MKPSAAELRRFRYEVMTYYRAHRREMFWRTHTRPYYIVVSEIMLQQTQVDRVRTKFASFIKRFPDWKSLAQASNHEVLSEWSGLGYNRRGLYLREIAKKVVHDPVYGFLNKSLISYKINHPIMYKRLLELPGIGPNTAGSILAFAFNQPIPFIETNIRSVFIHFFFKDTKKKISDEQLFPLIEQTLDKKNPREWYYALMDYGSYLKKLHPNPSRRSAYHSKQSAFKGSNRELRSNILKLILKKSSSKTAIEKTFTPSWKASNIRKNLIALEKEGFIKKKRELFEIVR